MSVFMVEPSQIKGQASLLRTQKQKLDDYSNEIISISNNIQLGDTEKKIKQKLNKIAEKLSKKGINCEKLGESLFDIIELYIKAENEILNKKTGVTNEGTANKSDNNGNSSSKENSDGDILDLIKESLGLNSLSDFEVTVIKTILGFIPGINCLVDIYDLASHIHEAVKDNKLSKGEAFDITMDVISLVADVVSFGALVKAMEGVAQGVKVAKVGGNVEKAINCAKKADDIADGVKNSRVVSPVLNTASNVKNSVVNGVRNSRVVSPVLNTASNVKNSVVNGVRNSRVGRGVRNTVGEIDNKVTDKVTDYIFQYSDRTRVTYTNTRDAAKKYTEEVVGNVKDFPKSKVKDVVKIKIRKKLDEEEQPSPSYT